MMMRKKPVICSFLMAAGIGFFLLSIQPAPPRIKMDPRLSQQLIEALTGISLERPLSPILASLGIDLKFPFAPPTIYLGFDRPANDMQAGIVYGAKYYVVSALHSLQEPVTSVSDLLALKTDKIFIDDPLFYAKHRHQIPHLELMDTQVSLVNKVANEEGTIAVVGIDDVTPIIRTLSPPISVSIWAGWRRSSVPVLDVLGFNNELDEKIAELFRRPQSPPDHPIISVVAVGDVMLARRIGQRLTKMMRTEEGATYPFAGVLDTLRKADIAIGNLECAVSDKGSPMPGKDYTFRAPPEAVNQLKEAGFDLLTLANNHTKDYGDEALVDTLDRLKKAGIKTVGAGRNRAEARSLKIITAKDGTRIGFLGYTMILPRDFLADSKNPGVAWTKDGGLARDIRRARKECDILMVQYHWGTEYTVHPTKAQRELAHRTIDLGADLIIGHHAHWIQEIEFYKGRFIAYSLGNFVFDMNHRPKVTEGLILTCEIRNKRIFQVTFDPVSIKGGQPKILPWGTAESGRSRQTIMKEVFAASGLLHSSRTVDIVIDPLEKNLPSPNLSASIK